MAADDRMRNGVALVIGVGKYPHPGIRTLDFAAHDAEAVAETLTDPEVCGFPADTVELLLDDRADRDAVVQRLSRWLPERARGAEIVLVYFAGHGLVQPVGNQDEGFLLPADADPDNPAGRGVAMTDVARWIGALQARAVVICLDCCHAGTFVRRGAADPTLSHRDFVLRPEVLQGLAGHEGRFLLASCGKGQYSVELKELRHGLFTYHLLQGLNGEGDRDGDGRVGVDELFEYVADAVAREAKERGVEQRPWKDCCGVGGVYLSRPVRRSSVSVLHSFERLRREEGDQAVVREIERRLERAGEAELPELLRRLGRLAHPAAVPALFRHLPHGCAAVREQARRALQAIGWEKALAAVEELARRADAAAGAALLDGLAVFEARGDLVRVLDRLGDVFQGDLRVRALQLLEHKRLGLDLEKTATIFREVRSPFRLQRVLGQGLFTASYLARDEQMDLEVVVRVLRPELACQSEIRRQFLDLCRKSIHYHHPNLAHTLEVRQFPEQDVYYIVRQYISGLTLQEVLAAGRQLEPLQVLEVLRQLLAALSELHAHGMDHGAIKPSNVFVCAGDKVVLGDLSLPPLGVGETLRQRLAYDYRYAAPEALTGSAGPRSDFYALGCVAYELLCGAPPFVSDHYNEVLVQQATRPVPPPRERRAGVSVALERLLLRLLEKEPGRRPASVDEALRLVEEVARVLRDGEQPPSVPPAGSIGPSPVRLLRDASLAEYRPPGTMFSMGSSRPLGETIPPDGGLPSLAANLPDSGERLPPATIPGYEILGIIGRGGMGVVYKARQEALQRTVALKMILHAGHTAESVRRRFQAEAQAVARLQHPNIVQIYEVGEAGGLPYFSLEYCPGGSLAGQLDGTPWSAARAAALVTTLARAVHFAHQKGVVHRDLKPANILLAEDGSPKITDFGLAKRLDAPGHTQSGEVVGTPSYMAPEQATGKGHEAGPATDVYALGSLFYELLTGRPPFKAASPLETVLKVISEDPASPRQLQPSVPRDLEVICLKCLERDPRRRYASAEALAEDLRRFSAGEGIFARPATPAERARRWVGRRPTVKAFLWWTALAGAAAALWQIFH
jgi:serine/threonine protein kinase